MQKNIRQKLAGRARDFLKEKNIPFGQRESQELIARLDGAKDLHAAQQTDARIKQERDDAVTVLRALVQTIEAELEDAAQNGGPNLTHLVNCKEMLAARRVTTRHSRFGPNLPSALRRKDGPRFAASLSEQEPQQQQTRKRSCYVVTHSHKRGDTIYVAESDTPLTQAVAIAAFNIDFEPEREESLSIEEVRVAVLGSPQPYSATSLSLTGNSEPVNFTLPGGTTIAVAPGQLATSEDAAKDSLAPHNVAFFSGCSLLLAMASAGVNLRSPQVTDAVNTWSDSIANEHSD